jgi:hypothetical protein
MALYRSQMVAYAQAQCDLARQLLAAHVPDGADCCTACGRPAPCPVRSDASQVHARYGPWLVTDPAPAVSGHRFPVSGRLVRPYVRNHGRG